MSRKPMGVWGLLALLGWVLCPLSAFGDSSIHWRRSAPPGFGNSANQVVSALAVYADRLWAGTANYESGAELWRADASGNWTCLMAGGFGNVHNTAIHRLIEFQGRLYAGTENADDGGELWRSSDGVNWQRVVSAGFGDATNAEINHLFVFGGQLYAGTWSYSGNHGMELWRSASGDAGSWTRVVANGFGDVHNSTILASALFNGNLYVGTYSLRMAQPFDSTGGEVWRSANGTSWTKVNTGGFGTANNQAVTSLAAFGGFLYAGTLGKAGHGAQVWRCRQCNGSDWARVAEGGFGDANNRGMSALEVFADRLYFSVGNSVAGMGVWRTADGTHWEQVCFDGFGSAANRAPSWDNAMVVHHDRLWIGTFNFVEGGQVWHSGLGTFLPAAGKGARP